MLCNGEGLGIALLVFAEDLVGLGIPKGTAAKEINGNQSDESDDQNDIGSLPLFSECSQNASLAGVAVIAELSLVVGPLKAVHVSSSVDGANPVRWVHKCVRTLCWGLTAS